MPATRLLNVNCREKQQLIVERFKKKVGLNCKQLSTNSFKRKLQQQQQQQSNKLKLQLQCNASILTLNNNSSNARIQKQQTNNNTQCNTHLRFSSKRISSSSSKETCGINSTRNLFENNNNIHFSTTHKLKTTTTATTNITLLKANKMQIFNLLCFALTLTLCFALLSNASTSFEKMTNRDFSGATFYTIQNVSLFECLGWCKEDKSCQSAAFSFVVNPFAALQETTCMLQNETQARQAPYLRQSASTGEQVAIVAQPQRATNLYFFNKIEVPAENMCARLWAFERFPNRRLRHHDKQPIAVRTKDECLALCLDARPSDFVCRSVEYNYLQQLCYLNSFDRRSPFIVSSSFALNAPDLLDAPGTDYFENACLLADDVCPESRIYDYAKVSLSPTRVAHFVELNYYPDKEMLVKSQAGCIRACTVEHEFICRSVLYRSSYKQGQPNCALYHLDHKTFPDGASTFSASNSIQPLLDSGDTSAVYLEAVCNESLPIVTTPSLASLAQSSAATMLPTTMSSSSASSSMSTPTQLIITSSTPPSSSSLSSSSSSPLTIVPNLSTNGIQIHPSLNNASKAHVQVTTSGSLSMVHGERYQQQQQASSSSASTLGAITTLSPQMVNSASTASLRLPASMAGLGSTVSQLPTSIQLELPSSSSSSSSAAANNRPPTHFVLANARVPSHLPSIPDKIIVTDDSTATTAAATFSHSTQPHTSDQNCDSHGFCYNVSLRCTDTKMVVSVRTQRPFYGRIYALGRSETCNAPIKHQNKFELEMLLSGQDCNTQSLSGVYTNTIVLQHHNVVLTKADKVYHVRCTYETASRNVSFGMMPVKDMFEVDMLEKNQETISIHASPNAPLPKISILSDGKEANTVRIGDRLTFRIEIPESTPYGIFARSCVAMAKEGRSTFDIIDDNGCPVDSTIFPAFEPINSGNVLQAQYEAFRFTESYGVIFQCNVKYCIGKCEPVTCGIGRSSVTAWGRKKRSIGFSDALSNSTAKINNAKHADTDHQLSAKSALKAEPADDMTLSSEIFVLDLNEKAGELQKGQQRNALDAQSSQSTSTASEHSLQWALKSQAEQAFEALNLQQTRHCLSSMSLFAVICLISLFFVLYFCLVAYFFARRNPKVSAIKHQYH